MVPWFIHSLKKATTGESTEMPCALFTGTTFTVGTPSGAAASAG